MFRFAAKRFRKAQCPIVERLVNSLMMHGRNNGKLITLVSSSINLYLIMNFDTGHTTTTLIDNSFSL